MDIEHTKPLAEFISTNVPGVGLVQYGSTLSKKYSDIDLIVTIKARGDFHLLHNFLLTQKSLINRFKGGNVIIMSPRTYKHIQFIDEIHPNHLAGPKRLIEPIAYALSDIRDHISILDWVPERLGKLDYYLSKDVIDEDQLMGVFYSLHHSFKVGNRVFPNVYQAPADKIFQFRKYTERQGKLDRRLLKNLYDPIRRLAIELVNNTLHVLYDDIDYQMQLDDCIFRYYPTCQIKLSNRPGYIDARRLSYHLSIYQTLFSQHGFRFDSKHLSKNIDLKNVDDNVLKITTAKAQSLIDVKHLNLADYQFVSPFRFGYLSR